MTTDEKKLSRETIIQTLANALKSLDYVHAFWEGGAAAFNRIDEWSDIDIYLLVDDDKVEQTFLAVEKELKALSPIKQKYDVPQTAWPGVFQAFYKLETTSEYLLIDLAILTLSSKERFLEPEIHGNNVFYFNKDNMIKPPSLDKQAFASKLRKRQERLEARFKVFNIFVQKEINRRNYLEAIDLYYAVTLATLVEALRIKYNPFHHDFKMRYIHHELPPRIIHRLKQLFFVKNEKDLQEKYNKATEWFTEVLSETTERAEKS